MKTHRPPVAPLLAVSAAVFGLAALALAFAPGTQAQDIRTRVTGSVAKMKVAVPDPDHTGDDPAVAREIVETLRDDLTFSGYFLVVEPRLYRLVERPPDGSIPHEDWQSIGAEQVVTLEVAIRANRVDASVRAYDNASKSLFLGRRYGGTTDIARRIAHQIADDLVKQLTGADGIARTRIAFVSRHGESKEIYLMDYDGHRIRRLTTDGTVNLSPAWSPDGTELAYVTWRGKQPRVDVISAEGERRTLNIVGGELSSSPEWSPDGKRMVYAADPDGNMELYVLDRATGRNTRLTRHAAIDTAPAWSPTGRQIAFTSDRSGTPQIYLMDAEGLNVRRISFTGNYNESAAWSPDGEELAYVSRIDGRFQIMVMNMGTEEVRRLTFDAGNNENPRWSPDGRHLVFASDRQGTYDIWTMRSDGTEPRRLTKDGNCVTPDWSRGP